MIFALSFRPFSILWVAPFIESSSVTACPYTDNAITEKVRDHRHSRWLEEAPLKGAKNLDSLVLRLLVFLGSVCIPEPVFHLILPY